MKIKFWNRQPMQKTVNNIQYNWYGYKPCNIKNDFLFKIFLFPFRVFRLFAIPGRQKISIIKYILDLFLKREIKYRKGKCLKCGVCCQGCFFQEKNLCTIYNRRYWCDEFYPVNREQLEASQKKTREKTLKILEAAKIKQKELEANGFILAGIDQWKDRMLNTKCGYSFKEVKK